MNMTERYEAIKANRRKLDECKQHAFIDASPPYHMYHAFHCTNCGGHMQAIEAAQYARGFKAAGGNPNLIIPNFD
jgi:hydrogenase maturation factor HypF (carbamoyltransferase family)